MISEHRPEAQTQWRFGCLEKKGILVRRSGVAVVVGHVAAAPNRRCEVRQRRLARFSPSQRTLAARVRCIREEESSVFAFHVPRGFSSQQLLRAKRSPNKAPEPTTTAVTIRAEPRLAPAAVVAHL